MLPAQGLFTKKTYKQENSSIGLLVTMLEEICGQNEIFKKFLITLGAIDTQCYFTASAQSDQHHETRRSYRHSLIIDPYL